MGTQPAYLHGFGCVQQRPEDGPVSAGTNSFKYIRAGYALWNTLVEYHIDKHWSAALNGNDLFDKSNYQTVATCDHDNC